MSYAWSPNNYKGKTVHAAPEKQGRPAAAVGLHIAPQQSDSRANRPADIITGAGALLLADTCPEVVPYDQSWVKRVLTNSMKAEHWHQIRLNGIPTSVMTLADCVAVAAGERGLRSKGKGQGAKRLQARSAVPKSEIRNPKSNPIICVSRTRSALAR